MPKIPEKRAASEAEPPPDAVLSEALRLEALGYAVVPCAGKKPILPDWPNVRLMAEELRSTFSRRPGLNIGIAWNLSGLIDVECDTDDGEAAVAALFDGDVPPTPTYRSRRGLHRLFRRPDGLPAKAVETIDGVEFRIGNGKGAMSLVPPSMTNGVVRQWLPGLSLGDIEPADLPPSVVARLRGKKTKPAAMTGDDGIPEASRNDELFRLGCGLMRAGNGPAAVEAALLAENAARCRPPLPEGEVAAIARSAVLKGAEGSKASDGDLTHSEILLMLAEACEFWRTPDGRAMTTFPAQGHFENWPVRSKTYKNWLSHKYYKRTGNAPCSAGMSDALGVLEGRAMYEGTEREAPLRVAEADGRIY